MATQKPTIKDIARECGVSLSTVSLVINNNPRIRAATRNKLLAAAEKLTGHSGISVAFGTEGPFLQELGMDTIILGPGNIDQAHQPDEYMSLSMIDPCIDFLRKIIAQHCN